MNIRFDCTKCGSCCHDLRLTLSVAEAIAWAGRGQRVQMLCEAMPWAVEPGPDDHEATHRRACSFPARSGAVPFRIAVVLVAMHDGACPNLQPDLRCGIYAERPRICRIYPLESRPFTAFDPARKRCPSEAWAPDLPVIARAGHAVDPAMRGIVAAHRALAISDVPAKALACQRLGITRAGFANEGFAVHEPTCQALIAALAPGADQAATRDWTIATNRISTANLLRDAECATELLDHGDGYIGSFASAA